MSKLKSDDHQGLRQEISSTLNKFSAEAGSNTPDFILAEYLLDCLEVFDHAINQREIYYGRPATAEHRAKVGDLGDEEGSDDRT